MPEIDPIAEARVCALGTQQSLGACSDQGLSHAGEFVCAHHLQMAPPSLIQRKGQTWGRLQWLRARWDDDDYYERVVASGRYLKFCEALRWAEELDDMAWDAIKQSIVVREASQQGAAMIAASATQARSVA